MMPLSPSPASSAPMTIGLLSVTVRSSLDLGAGDAYECLRVERRASDEQAVDASEVRDGAGIGRVDAAAVEDGRRRRPVGREPPMDGAVHRLDVLGWGRHRPDADRPDRLVRDDETFEPLGIERTKRATQLSRDDRT